MHTTLANLHVHVHMHIIVVRYLLYFYDVVDKKEKSKRGRQKEEEEWRYNTLHVYSQTYHMYIKEQTHVGINYPTFLSDNAEKEQSKKAPVAKAKAKGKQ